MNGLSLTFRSSPSKDIGARGEVSDGLGLRGAEGIKETTSCGVDVDGDVSQTIRIIGSLETDDAALNVEFHNIIEGGIRNGGKGIVVICAA